MIILVSVALRQHFFNGLTSAWSPNSRLSTCLHVDERSERHTDLPGQEMKSKVTVPDANAVSPNALNDRITELVCLWSTKVVPADVAVLACISPYVWYLT